MAKKKLYFYEVRLFTGEQELNYCKLKEIYDEIFNQHCVNNALRLNKDGQDRITLDVIENTSTYLFCRIGKEKENNAMVVREYASLEKTDVLSPAETEKKSVEMTTYFYLNYRSGIIAFVNNQSAPKAEALNYILSLYNKEYKTDMVPILNDDYVKILFKKGAELSKIELEIPIPNAAYLESVLELKTEGKNSIEELLKDDIKRVTLVLQGPERGILTDDENVIENVVGIIKNSVSSLKKAKVSGKTPVVKTQEFNLMEQLFSYEIYIEPTKRVRGRRIAYTVDELADIYKETIRDAYFANKNSILLLTNRYGKECE